MKPKAYSSRGYVSITNHLLVLWNKLPLSTLSNIFKQSLFVNAGFLVAVDAVNSLGGVVYYWVAARLYTSSSVGITSAVLSALSIVSLVSGFGVGNALVRFLPVSSSPSRLINQSFAFNTFNALWVGGIYLYLLLHFKSSLSDIFINHYAVFGFLAFGMLVSINTNLRMSFIAGRKANYFFFKSLINNTLRVLFALILVSLNFWGLVTANALAMFASVIISVVFFFPRIFTNIRILFDFDLREFLDVLPYSFTTFLSGLFQQLPTLLLPVIVLESLGSSAAGHAQVAWMVGVLLSAPGVSLAASSFAEASNKIIDTNKIYLKSVLMGILITLPLSILVILFSRPILLIFGRSYSMSGNALLMILAIAAPFAVVTGLYFSYLRVVRKIRELVCLSAVLFITTVLVAVLYLPRLGIPAYGVGWLLGQALIFFIVGIKFLKSNSRYELNLLFRKFNAGN
jgi:O-antigen/teichoic acid export membrane protein